MFDHTIIADIRNGNEEKLTKIYRTYRDEFISWAFRNYQCPEETAKDIYQVIVVIFYENIIR
jgi:RNA polymerase sigma-70 factor (ECF subfamily)